MRTLVVLALALSFAVLHGAEAEKAKSAPPRKAPVKIPLTKAPAVKGPATSAPAKSTPATEPAASEAKGAAKKQSKADEEIGKIEGLEIARSGNRFVGVQIVEGKFKLTFYNEKKKPVPPDVARAVLRWDPKYKVGMERVVLTPGGDANSLSAEKFIRPPYNFKLTIVLLGEGPEGDDGAAPGGETHVVDFRQ